VEQAAGLSRYAVYGETLPGKASEPVSAPIAIAVLAFLAALGLALWLARGGRERTAFAAIVGSPMFAAAAFAAVSSLPRHEAAGAAATAAPAATSTPAVAPAAAGGAPEADGLRRHADELRLAKRYGEARDAYEQVVKSAPGDVDAWADLADAQAAAAGGDLKAGSSAMDRALAIDPNHLKALWLKASLELQEKHYASAGQLWERLLAQLPPDSNDARIVRANLDETRALASKQGSGP
jgi:cytochrome c-type biogenesis protein CcmH